jgi:hypothetical protein
MNTTNGPGMATAIAHRRTVIAHGRLAMRELRLDAARNRRHGLQVMTFDQFAARMAGGFLRSIDDEALRGAIQATLLNTTLGELDGIKALPGMIDAAADTLKKAWHAGIDLQSRAVDHPRIRSIAKLEEAVITALPPALMRPNDLVTAGLQRLDRASTLFGSIDIVGITELAPCWRPLLFAISTGTPVRWIAGPRSVPTWLDGSAVEIVRGGAESPTVLSVNASTAYHEAIEAVRWARQLISSGKAEPSEVAFASVMPSEYDDHFLALSVDADLDLHFVHGVKVTTFREGQSAAALADVLMRGLSQTRMRRLAALLGTDTGPFKSFPDLARGLDPINRPTHRR